MVLKKMNKRKNIIILGGEGFVGRNLANYLCIKNNCFSLGLNKSPFSVNRVDEFLKINPYKEKIKQDYDVVIHLIDNKTDDIDYFRAEELKLVNNLKINKNKHLILFSSAVVYANPDSEYGKRKTELESIYTNFCNDNNIGLTIFRLFNTYGPYLLPDRQGSLISNIIVNHLNNKTTIIKDINAERDFIFSKDIGKFVEYVILNKRYGIFDLSSNKLTSIDKIHKEVGYIVGENLKIDNLSEIEEVKSPSGNNILVDNIKLTSIGDGLKESIVFYRNNLDLINKIRE